MPLTQTIRMTPAAAKTEMPPPSALPLVEPADAAELARVLADANAAGKAVLPRGGGTKTDWGNPPRAADLVLSTRKLDRVLEHAAGDMTVTVEAGCTITALQRHLALRGQRLAIDPLWPDPATIGGVVATNDNGALRGAFGGLRDLIIGVTVALADGTLARSGGKVVKNVAGYDLPKLMVGSLGTLGVITEATFRLHPLPKASEAIAVIAPDFAAATRVILAVQDSTLATAGVEVQAEDRMADIVIVAIRLEGSPEAVNAQWHQAWQLGSQLGCCAASFWPVWRERERLFADEPHSAVCKVSFLPARLSEWCDAVARAAQSYRLRWATCLEGAGVGWLRVTAPDEARLREAVVKLRADAVALGGSLVLLRWPGGVKRDLDAWGDVGDALPLMRRIKDQFDSNGTLNPGRFVGGI